MSFHREVTAGLFVGSGRLPSPSWFPDGLVVVDLRTEGEPPPERVGPPGVRDRSVTDLVDRLVGEVRREPLALGAGGVPDDGDAYLHAVHTVCALWPMYAVLLVSGDGITRAPLVAYGALRCMGIGAEAALARVGVMVGDVNSQAPDRGAIAWAERRLAGDEARPAPAPTLH